MSPPITIGIDARPAVWHRGTGIGNYTHQLVTHLQRLDPVNSYRIAWPTGQPLPQLPPKWTAALIPRDRSSEGPALAKWIRQEGIQVYHVPQNGIHAPADCGPARLVVTVHDLIPWITPEFVRYGYIRRFLREVPETIERASMVITVSRQTARDLTRILGVAGSKIRVVYPAPEGVFRPVPPGLARSLASGKYGLDAPYAIYVGGLNPRKNVRDLIYAFDKVCRGLIPQTRLLIVGDSGTHAAALRDFVDILRLGDYVVTPGEVPLEDLPALYSAAQFAVYPSLYEGFGLPPVEAMACGTPVICTDAGSLPEIVGRAALIVPAGDVTALATAIRDLSADPGLRRRLRRRGAARATRYSWPGAAAEILRIYTELASQEEEAPR